MRSGSLLALVLILSTSSCADVQEHTKSNRAVDQVTYTTVGDIMLKVNVSENLPNAFGKSDIFGRQRNRGFSDIRYMGLAPDGRAVFRRRDVDVLTDETTLNRSRLSVGAAQIQPSGSGATALGVGVSNRAGHVEGVPPDTVEFMLDLKAGRMITMHDKTIEVLSADAAGIKFVVR